MANRVISQADPRRRFLKPAEWPEADRLAWVRATTPASVLDELGSASKWSPKTKNFVANAYGRWIAWLTETSPEALLLPAAERATREAVTAYVKATAEQVGATTLAIYLRDLRFALEVLVPDGDWHWLRRLRSKFTRGAKPVRDKLPRLVPVDDLLRCGAVLMASSTDAASSLEAATLHRDGLIIAVLALRPLRLSNLALIRIGQHLLLRGPSYALSFEPGETKTRTDRLLDMPFPAELTAELEVYLNVHRPVLVQRQAVNHPGWARTGHLWVSQRGSALSEEAIYSLIMRHTRAILGKALNPHVFRDCVATFIAEHAPADVEVTQAILGHSTMRTSRKWYNHAGAAPAIARHQAVIAKLRRKAGK